MVPPLNYFLKTKLEYELIKTSKKLLEYHRKSPEIRKNFGAYAVSCLFIDKSCCTNKIRMFAKNLSSKG